ncbi:MAG: penicillin-binding transpeptidase domain-containing protein [Gammaproteobacteria bacterium]|nr:penicillin-binding transpeptidase domain-containing protein [Gammaproteobacteria bacterium]
MTARNNKIRVVKPAAFGLRRRVVLTSFIIVMAILTGRAVFLQVMNAEFLVKQGNARHLRVVKENAVRGMIMDRNGAPLAVSTPVDSVWVQPGMFVEARSQWSSLAHVLDISEAQVARLVRQNRDREFLYLKRHVTPDVAEHVSQLNVPGVSLLREYRRYYPTGAVTGHVLGFTNIDDQGQEGIELVFNDRLAAQPGKVQVFKDRHGKAVESVDQIQRAIPGSDMRISLDRRLQYLVYRELTETVLRHKARGGSAVILDAKTGEILAMANAPDFNPNNRLDLRSNNFRNRAVTDVFEPGSTVKPFTVAAALESGLYTPGSRIDTTPGVVKVGAATIRDEHKNGMLSVAGVIQKSSNVGAARIALAMNREVMRDFFAGAGFGELTGINLPGEVDGNLPKAERWVKIDQAVMSFGYGLSVTALQLARAYTAFANDGMLTPLSVLPLAEARPRRVMSVQTARQMRSMLELAAGDDGTGAAAQVRHYRVAGKTGTVHKLVNGEYADDRYLSLFAGMIPASDPRLVMVVMIDDPQGKYFGGQVAAPVFGKVMSGAMRILNVAPDAPVVEKRWARAGSGGAT